MSIEEIIIHKVRILPLDKQQEALDFVEFLLAKIQVSYYIVGFSQLNLLIVIGLKQ
ncbi:hypothetical protein [Nostoc sp. JL33]|uniref:hypothetical protein n=1 Tax=Nostoc sp. JL33 TaxID=2815396 RepID=UPI0025DCD90B|nr:hypothetical protein [Nostoc sp. JL33]